MKDLTLLFGRAQGIGGDAFGGAIWNAGNLSLLNDTLRNNVAQASGGNLNFGILVSGSGPGMVGCCDMLSTDRFIWRFCG